MTDRITEADMVALLAKRYSHRNTHGLPRYINATQAQLFDQSGTLRFIDFIAVDSQVDVLTDPTTGKDRRLSAPVHGFEIKVSRADWLRELKTHGAKSALWRTYCHYWWIVVPDASIVQPGELPDGWGLLVGRKRLARQIAPQRNEQAQPIPGELMLSIARYSHRLLSTKDTSHV